MDKEFNWLEYERTEEKKPSEIIHLRIHEMKEKHSLDFKNCLFVMISGPGSYTGMRLSEGIANILKLAGFNVLSFFSFEIPVILKHKSGRWITNAFKNQFFIYEWDENKSHQYLINAEDINFTSNYFSNTTNSLFSNLVMTSELIFKNPKEIFSFVLARNTYSPSFYFRTLDEEFKSLC